MKIENVKKAAEHFALWNCETDSDPNKALLAFLGTDICAQLIEDYEEFCLLSDFVNNQKKYDSKIHFPATSLEEFTYTLDEAKKRHKEIEQFSKEDNHKIAKGSKDTIIPKIIHFIWFGKKSLRVAYALNVLTCLMDNKKNGYTLMLWINPEYFNRWHKKNKYLELLKSKGVLLMDFTIFSERFQQASLVAKIKELHMEHPVIASDIIRWAALYYFGGYYIDTDTKFLECMPHEEFDISKEYSAPENYQDRIPNLIIDSNVKKDNRYEYYSNSFLAAPAYSNDVYSCFTALERNINTREFAEKILLFETLDRATPQNAEKYAEFVLNNSGPSFVFKALGDTEDRVIYKRHNYYKLMDIKYHEYDSTWFTTNVDFIFTAQKKRAYDTLNARAAFFHYKKSGDQIFELSRREDLNNLHNNWRDNDDDNRANGCTIC